MSYSQVPDKKASYKIGMLNSQAIKPSLKRFKSYC